MAAIATQPRVLVIDGTPRKLMDSSRIRALSWEPKVPLDEGIARPYRWFLDNIVKVKKAA